MSVESVDLRLKVVRRSASKAPPEPAIRLTIGQTFRARCFITFDGADEDGEGDGDAVPLTGKTVVCSLKKHLGGNAIVPRQLDHVDDAGGEMELTIAASELVGQQPGTFKIDFVLIDDDTGDRTPISAVVNVDVRLGCHMPGDPVAVLPEQDPLGQGPPGAGAGDLAIGGAITSGEPLGVIFADADGKVAQDVPFFRYDPIGHYLMIGDGDPAVGEDPIAPSGPWAVDLEFDSALNAFVQLHNRHTDGAADIWLLAGGLSMGVIFGASETNTALPSFYAGGLGILFDYQLTLGDVSRAYMRLVDSAIQLLVPVYRMRTANGTIAANTFVKLSSVAGRVEQWTITDEVWQIAGVALDAGSLGIAIRVAEIRGQSLQLKTDGAAACVAGQPANISILLDGRVNGDDTTVRVGIFESSDPGGTPNALVTIRW